ncbi:hypothetical protein [Paracoccus homiensis]|uniref:Uncharacterized protein n=1 Tax=Paracoccus homiensis TaxID=364199 RepID=A0A1I0IZP5_9RHOB|nr:hypothetical protein [Paracoccus homiensis]SEU02951.1 hypothetical protein SAMN04489858_12045 [Paracoccus homiensis]
MIRALAFIVVAVGILPMAYLMVSPQVWQALRVFGWDIALSAFVAVFTICAGIISLPKGRR